MIIRNGQMGAYREKISDGQLIGLLEGFNDQQETKIKFKIKYNKKNVNLINYIFLFLTKKKIFQYIY